MATANVTEVLPPTDLSRSELQDALVALEQDASPLPQLKERARTVAQILPKDATQENYAEMGAALSEARLIKQTPTTRLGNFYMIVRRVLAYLDTQSNKTKNAVTEIEAIALPWMKSFEQHERSETAKEQKQMGDGAVVKPNLPTVAGYRKTVNYRAQVTDAKKFLAAYRKEPRGPLAEFVTIDEAALNKRAREMKDSKAFMRLYKYTSAWED